MIPPPTEHPNPIFCLHCGFAPRSLSAGFDTDRLLEFRKKGKIEYYWDCGKCDKINYFSDTVPVEVIDRLIGQCMMTKKVRSPKVDVEVRKKKNDKR